MYARVTIVQVQSGKTTEAVQIYHESIIPAARQQLAKVATFLAEQPVREAYEVSVQA